MTISCYPFSWRVFNSAHKAQQSESNTSAQQPLLPTKITPKPYPHTLLIKQLAPNPRQLLLDLSKWRNHPQRRQPANMQVLTSVGLGIIDSAFMMLIDSMQQQPDSLSVVILSLVKFVEEFAKIWGQTQADSQKYKLHHTDTLYLPTADKKAFFSRQLLKYTMIIDISSMGVLIGLSCYNAGGLHGMVVTFTAIKTVLAYSQARQIGFYQLMQIYVDEELSQEQDTANNPCIEKLEQGMQHLIMYLVTFIFYICARNRSVTAISVQQYCILAMILGTSITFFAKLRLLPFTSYTKPSTIQSATTNDETINNDQQC